MNDLNERRALSEENRIEINKEIRIQWILWIGIIGMPIVFIIMCHVFGDRFRENIPANSSRSIQTLRIIFIIIGAFDLVLSYGIRKYFYSSRFKGFKTKLLQPDTHSRIPKYIMVLRQINYVPMTIPSGLSIFGFLLFMRGDSLVVFYAFIITSLLGTLYQHPRKKEALEFCARFLQNQESEKA